MIQSMTGYGKAIVPFKDKKIHIEVKSLNSKNLDITTRIAPLYREKEMEMRAIIAKELLRGKVDLVVWIERETENVAAPSTRLWWQATISNCATYLLQRAFLNLPTGSLPCSDCPT